LTRLPSSSDGAATTVSKTPPGTRKRKLDHPTSLSPEVVQPGNEPKRKASKTTHADHITQVEAGLPATPQTLSDKPMDSDDDFNSMASSVDLGEEMSSSVDFGAAGRIHPPTYY
jgi:hypothetical protein